MRTIFPLLNIKHRLNPPMQEVVMKEIIKWSETEVMYLISNSKWVRQVQPFSKKRGTTIVADDNNELIQLRLITG